MRKQRPRPMRNKLNLTDVRQVRLVKKRLGLSDTELTEIVIKSVTHSPRSARK